MPDSQRTPPASGQVVRHLRLSVGMSQRELARRLGWRSQAAVSMLETQGGVVTIGKALRIADALGVDRLTMLRMLAAEELPPRSGRREDKTNAAL